MTIERLPNIRIPKVSVVMPVYNASEYLEEAVASLFVQSFRNFEILAFDDGSTDGSIRILRHFAAQGTRVCVFERKHSGYSPHLNEGVQRARGEFIARMDADDVCEPTRFEQQLAFLAQRPDVVAVGSSAWLIDEWGDPFTTLSSPATHTAIDAAHLRGEGGAMPHPSIMMRTEAVRQIGGYRPEFEPAEDLDLLLRLAEIGKLANITKPLLRYRVHHEMTSIAQATKQQIQVRRILADTWERRSLTGSPPEIPSPRSENAHAKRDLNQLRMQRALHNGFSRTAHRYAWRVVRQRPWSPMAWAQLLRVSYARVRMPGSRLGPLSRAAKR